MAPRALPRAPERYARKGTAGLDVSPSNANNDTVKKLRLYQRVSIPHYWIIDTRDSTLTVLRWSADGYVTVLRAEHGETVRAEPFEAVELHVSTLFGEDPPESK